MAHEELVIEPSPQAAPNAPEGSLDWMKYIGLASQILQAIVSGSGSFITWTPLGRKRIIIEDA